MRMRDKIPTTLEAQVVTEKLSNSNQKLQKFKTEAEMSSNKSRSVCENW